MGVSLNSEFYYEDPKLVSRNKNAKKKNASGKQVNRELELMITFNEQRCWALLEKLTRFRSYQGETLESQENMFHIDDKVTIDDCFRQFMRPEKLS